MKTLSIFVIAILIPIFCIAQKPPLKFGKISETEISLNELNGADAVILCDYGEYYLDGKLGLVFFYFKRHLRIKILTSEGLKYATQTIPYYDLTKATYLTTSTCYELRAQTLNADGKGKIEKTKVKTKNVLRSNVYNEFNTEVTVNFPDVKVGSIIEYEINIPTINLVNPPVWYLQYDIPVLWSELRITVPQDFEYGVKAYNCESIDELNRTVINTSLFYNKGSMVYMANRIQMIKTNIPPADYSVSADNRMYLKFMLEYASRKFAPLGMEELYKAIDPRFKYLDKAEKYNTLKNPAFVLYNKPGLEKLARDLMRDPGFGPPQIINIGYNDTIKIITAGCKNDVEKSMAIYRFVSSRFSWDSTYRMYVRDGFSLKLTEFFSRFASSETNLNTSLSKTLRKSTGSNSDINFILINLLNTSGIKAYPVLVSTLDFDRIDTSFFNLHQFNHVVASFESDGQTYLLDAVEKDDGSILTKDAINDFGLLIKKDTAYWISLNE